MTKRSGKAGREQRGAPPMPFASAPAESSLTAQRRSRILEIGLPIALSGLFFLLVWTCYPFHDVSEFDPDEGNNVIKALMMARGHELYSEIWNDQPPLFTYMLRGWFALTDWTVHEARILVLLCSCVLLWGLYGTVRLSWGHGGAIASTCLLATTWYYVALSVSAMLAIPTLMLAMLSAFCITRYRSQPHAVWLALSGASLSLSLFTKLFVLPLAPLLFLAVLYLGWSNRSAGQRRGRWVVPALLWLAGFALTAALLFVTLVPWSDVVQLIRPHLDARRQMSGKGYDKVFQELLRADSVYALFGLVGLFHVIRRRDWLSLVPVIWYGLSVLALYRHRPLWYHHYPMLSVPMCWMAASALGPLLSRELWRTWRPWKGPRSAVALTANGLTLALSLVSVKQAAFSRDPEIPSKLQREQAYAEQYLRMTPRDDYIAAVMKQWSDNTRYVITDRQILPFTARLIVPPGLSVTSVKRFQSGHLTIEKLLGMFEKYKPEQVFLSWRRRIRPTPELQTYLDSHYRLIYTNPPGDLLYVTPALADNALAALEQAAIEVPQSEDGWYNLGVQLAAAGRNAEAVGHLERSIGIRPTKAAYESLAKVFEALGKAEAAAEARGRAERLKR